MAEYDAVVVGSGINSLAAAALLSRGGWSVCVLEAERELGGAVKTAELTEPGFRHDVFSAWHPLWVGGAAHAELGEELALRGLEYLNTEHPTGTLYPDGEAAFLTTNTDANAAELARHAPADGEAWRRVVVAMRQQLAWLPAARICMLANLGKYIPGKVWSVAGAAFLAQQAGVAPAAAVAAAIVLQALALASGVVLVAVVAPAAFAGVGSWLVTATVIAGVAALAGVVVLTWPPACFMPKESIASSKSVSPMRRRNSCKASTPLPEKRSLALR